MTEEPEPGLAELDASGLDPRSPELLVSLVWLVLGRVPVDEGELRAARRRAVLVLASGGDPHRDVDLDSPAVVRLAEELDAPERRRALGGALEALDTSGLATVEVAVETLRAAPELAWRFYALAQVADELADE
ncbi:MAG TPA: hypothetical protein VFA56_09135 [Gaiellaceae bacterium]|nr:hypothetical protein [Gaiellaceae bacterium]